MRQWNAAALGAVCALAPPAMAAEPSDFNGDHHPGSGGALRRRARRSAVRGGQAVLLRLPGRRRAVSPDHGAEEKIEPLACPKDAVTREQLVGVFLDWAEANPQSMDEPAGGKPGAGCGRAMAMRQQIGVGSCSDQGPENADAATGVHLQGGSARRSCPRAAPAMAARAPMPTMTGSIIMTTGTTTISGSGSTTIPTAATTGTTSDRLCRTGTPDLPRTSSGRCAIGWRSG